MVKRPKSPEVVEDCRFFTVYQPYPLNPDWHEERDQIEAAKWVAECIGPNHLWAIHEKPRAGNMILLEVSKDFVDHGLLLGEHRWADFLKDPTLEEKARVTQVYHSFYARSRDAQKDGWKVVPVNARWLYKWVPGKGRIMHPYPETYWCSTPVEDRTNKPLCRPLPSRSLPVEQLTPPPRPSAPVVGSSTWVAKQAVSAPSTAPSAKPSVPNAWAKPLAGIAVAKRASQPVERDRSAPSATQPGLNRAEFLPVSGSNSVPLNGKNSGKNPRIRPMPLQKFVAEAAKANATKGKSAWGAIQPASPAGVKSPLAEEPPKGPTNAWASPLKIPPANRAKPSSSATTPSTRGQSPWGAPETSIEAWFTGETYEKTPKDQTFGAPASGDSSNKNTRPSSPHQSDHPAEDSKDSKYDAVDFVTPQRDKRPNRDVTSPKAADKKLDKGKKKKEAADSKAAESQNKDEDKKDAGDTIDFSAADEIAESSVSKDKGKEKEAVVDWASAPLDRAEEVIDKSDKKEDLQLDQLLQTPDVKLMDVDASVDSGEREPAPNVEEQSHVEEQWNVGEQWNVEQWSVEGQTPKSPPRELKGWSTSSRPESPPYKGRKGRDSPRSSEFNSRNGSRSRRPPPSVIKMGDRPVGRSNGAWDHSGFSQLEPSKRKFKDRSDKPRNRQKGEYDKPKDRYADERGDNNARDKYDKSQGKFDKTRDKKSEASTFNEFGTFDWSTLEGQVEDWSRSPPPESNKGKEKVDETIESLDLGERLNVGDWSSKPAEGSKDAAMDVDQPKAGWGEWGPQPPDTKKGKAKSSRATETLESIYGSWGPPPPDTRGNAGSSRATPKNASMDIDAPQAGWGEWGPPPGSPMKVPKGKSIQEEIFKGAEAPPEANWGEWGPPPPSPKISADMDVDELVVPEKWAPPPSHLKKKVQSKVFRPGSIEPTPNKTSEGLEEPEVGWGEWGPPPPPPEPKLPKGKLFRSDKPKSTRKDSTKDSWKTPREPAKGANAHDTAWGKWGPSSSDSKKGAKDRQSEASVPTVKQDVPQSAWGEWGPAPSDSTKDSTTVKIEENDINMTEIASDEWGPAPSASVEEPKGKTPEVDDYTDWGHAPHKARKLASKKAEGKNKDRDNADPGDFEDQNETAKDAAGVGKLEDWLLPSVSESTTDSATDATVKVEDTGDWGVWSASAPVETKQSPKDDPNDWGAAPTSKQSEKQEADVDDNIGFTAEDWGMAPVPEESSNTASKDEFGSKLEDWGLPGDNNADASEFNPWEKKPDMSAWGNLDDYTPGLGIPDDFDPSLFEYRRKLRCPTHNYHCKPKGCRDMEKWYKEVERMESEGIVVAKDARPSWARDPNLPPVRARGSKRGPRVRKKREPRSIGHLRGFEDIDKAERAEREALGEDGVNEGENHIADDAAPSEEWQAPIGGTAEEWGVQSSSMDAWA